MASSICLLVAVHEHMVSSAICSSHYSFYAHILARGLTNSFAVFETHYTHTKLPTISPSTISWIGSLQLFLTLFVGVFAGWFLDSGYVRVVVATGIGFEIIGMLATSFCTRYWHLVLAQGLCVGIGSGMLAFTSAAVIPFYFVKRRMLVAGIVSTGSSIGN
jgi:MFS family permease